MYIEAWPPHVDARLARRDGRPAPAPLARASRWSIAAYQHVYREHDRGLPPTSPRRSRWPRCSRTAPPTCSPARTDGCSSTPTTSQPRRRAVDAATCCARWYDFLVEHDELLHRPRARRRDRGVGGPLQRRPRRHVRTASTSPTSRDRGVSGGESWPCPARTRGSWSTSSTSSARTTPCGTRRDARWVPPAPATLRIRRVGPALPRVRVADPDRAGRLVDVPVRVRRAPSPSPSCRRRTCGRS